MCNIDLQEYERQCVPSRVYFFGAWENGKFVLATNLHQNPYKYIKSILLIHGAGYR